jgi:hypothetical protein
MWTLFFACGGPDPEPVTAPLPDSGRVTLHRLNRREYDRTVRDLFGTTLTPAADTFPEDDFGYGFSNVAEVLSISPLLVEMWEAAADDLLDELFGIGTRDAATQVVEIESLATDVGLDFYGWALQLAEEGTVAVPFSVAEPGDHVVTLHAFGQGLELGPPHLDVALDDAPLDGVDLDADEASPGAWSWTLALDSGDHTLALTYTNEVKEYVNGVLLDRNAVLDRVSVQGPLGVPVAPPAGASAVLLCAPEGDDEAACAETIVHTFASRAWRRPVTPEELDGLMALYAEARNQDGDWQEGVRTALRAVLMSPWFLFRVELDADPLDPTPHPLTAYELASRLSYFLWSSMPDDRLLMLAETGALLRDDVLDAEVRRMIADPKAAAVVDGLGVEWLFIEAVEASAPDPAKVPDWDEGLRQAMMTESRLFVADILLTDRSMLDLVNAPETFVDARLAAWYGLPPPVGTGFVRVSTADRRGILTQGGLLTANSYPTRTSPVKRGKWVLTYLLCEAPAPPPPGVPPIDQAELPDTGIVSLREQMELHRSDPACASCHKLMDPIGFGLEGFSAVGQLRTTDDNGAPVDSAGVLPDGNSFSGAAELADIIAADPGTPACMTSTVYTYALGRSPRVEDIALLESIESEFAAGGYRFADLASAIARSPAFRWRAGEEAP